jgi:hypothetical protein
MATLASPRSKDRAAPVSAPILPARCGRAFRRGALLPHYGLRQLDRTHFEVARR